MKLNESNYFSLEAEQKYMSSSQYKAFSKCEKAAMAKINGEWFEEPSVAMLVGSYVDAHFSGEMALFKAQNTQIFKRDGDLKSEYLTANQIIQVIEDDPLMMEYLQGEKQRIFTGEIAGVPFKAKFDVYFSGVRIVDMKVMRDFKPVWNDELRVKQNFVDAWGYSLQGAIYQKLEGNKLPFIIAAATKEEYPDKALLAIPQDVIDDRLELVEAYAPRYAAIKAGLEEPTACGKCAYCRSVKKLTEVIDYRDMEE
ncbi:MAG: PD-(D/E)XK nuclease-like domain-containing protein [Oscillospiraceae bacterium]|nr:PD-(D/E)XK nuclease-like domain-containing protein [Oscillospiraceae bacterium]